MSMRLARPGLERGERVTLELDGREVAAHRGETLATVVLCERGGVFRNDTHGHARGAWCGMGVCGECSVVIERSDGTRATVRACLTPVEAGLRVHLRRESGDAA